MVNVDRFVALALLAFFIAYIFISFQFQLLPFEKLQPFKPNTAPKAIGIIGAIISVIVLIKADGEENKDNKGWRTYEWKTFIGIVVALSVYAFCIKPIGFVVSTSLFLTAGAWILGERSYIKLPIIAIISALIIWLLVDKLLGIYLSPLPMFLN